MKILKSLVVMLSIFTVLVFSYGILNENEVFDTILNYYDRNPSALINNEYKKENTVSFVKLTDNFEANNKDDIMNIYYTIIYSGMDEFTFFCSKDYIKCTEDVVKINDDAQKLSQMNNFVNIYNTFSSIKTTYTTNNKITLSIKKVYSVPEIFELNKKVDKIYNEIINENDNDRKKIKTIHDYIINNTKYNEAEEKLKELTPSSTAIGPLFNGLATCNGYTDAMGLFLDKMGLLNLRISNSEHIWNLVYLDNKWYHLDLTWDDPTNNLNENILLHDYFLITTDNLIKIDSQKNEDDHLFDNEMYYFVY